MYKRQVSFIAWDQLDGPDAGPVVPKVPHLPLEVPREAHATPKDAAEGGVSGRPALSTPARPRSGGDTLPAVVVVVVLPEVDARPMKSTPVVTFGPDDRPAFASP